MRFRFFKRIICWVFGHRFVDETFIDNHDNFDGIVACERCKEYF